MSPRRQENKPHFRSDNVWFPTSEGNCVLQSIADAISAHRGRRFRGTRTPFQADRGRRFSLIADDSVGQPPVDGALHHARQDDRDGSPDGAPTGTWSGSPTAPLTWMERLRRVFAIDLSLCPHCGGRLRVIAGGRLRMLRISPHRGRPFQTIVDDVSEERGRRFKLIVDDVSV